MTDPSRRNDVENDPPLAGLRILDLTSLLPGPFASQVLVDLGATVVKVERPGGDPMRHLSPGPFTAVNRGKHVIELDLRDPEDLQVAIDLAEEADVLLESGRPGATARLGLGFEELAARNPRLVYLSLSGWGPDGPAVAEAGHNNNYLARAGATSISGPPGTPPTDANPVALADLGASLYGVIAVLAALREPRTARHLDVSLYASSLALLVPRFAEYVEKGMPGRDDLLRRPAHGVFEAGDGQYLTIAAVEPQFWRALCELIDRSDLAEREDLKAYDDRCRNADEVDAVVAEVLRTRPRDEWIELMRAHDIPVAPVLRPEEAVADPQARHLGFQPAWPEVRSFLPVVGFGALGASGASDATPGASDLPDVGERVRASRWAEL